MKKLLFCTAVAVLLSNPARAGEVAKIIDDITNPIVESLDKVRDEVCPPSQVGDLCRIQFAVLAHEVKRTVAIGVTEAFLAHLEGKPVPDLAVTVGKPLKELPGKVKALVGRWQK